MGQTKAAVRVVTFLPNLDYIRKKRGIEGEKAVMVELKRRGYDYDFRKMKKTEWVPADVRREFLYVVRDVLGWDEKKIFEMGVNAPRLSFVIRMFLGLFIKLRRVFEHGSEIWREHYSKGEFIFTDFEETPTGGRAVVIIKDFDVDPLFCEYLRGYFVGILKLARARDVKMEEVKCTFRGDVVHEYHASWKY